MRILVTGGAGFIGSNLCDGFVARGHEVAVFDNLSTGFREFVNPAARFYASDLTDAGAVDRCVAEFRPEVREPPRRPDRRAVLGRGSDPGRADATSSARSRCSRAAGVTACAR